jgi:hypothetical protein
VDEGGLRPNQSAGEFFFQCPRDGTYRVSLETLRQFITPTLREDLDDRMARGAVGAELRFDGGCPRCEPDSSHTVTLVALKRTIN